MQLRRLRRADVPSGTETFARFLIGRRLVRRFDDDVLSGRIVETEAYLPSDPASHAYRGPTARNRAMFAEHMHAYVYFIYGTAYCLNVSTEASGVGAAVLIRAVEPVDGIAIMRARRGAGVKDRDLLRGPGRLCAALDIDRRFDGADLDTEPGLWLADDGAQPPQIGTSTRIGLTRAIDVRHRFFARGSAYLSGRSSLSADV